jgi:hypothetical protein
MQEWLYYSFGPQLKTVTPTVTVVDKSRLNVDCAFKMYQSGTINEINTKITTVTLKFTSRWDSD